METFARAVLLLFVAVQVLNYVQGGWPQVLAWNRAKFLGSPSASTLN